MLNAFGRNYEEIGSSDKGLILKNSGKIKIQWGKKFIDLLDSNGNINTQSQNLIKSVSSTSGIQQDGFYYINGSLVAKIGENIVELSSESNSVYVSFLQKQEASSQEKYQALQNIGFIYPSLNDYNVYPTNGIVYIEDSQTLYIVNNGKLSKFQTSISNSTEGQFVITGNNTSEGALIIEGTGSSNSLKFNSLKIYSNDNTSIFEANEDIQFLINNNEVVTINSNGLETNSIQSKDASESYGYRINEQDNKYVLDIDDVYIRNFSLQQFFEAILNLYKNEEHLVDSVNIQIQGTGEATINVTSNLSWNVVSEDVSLSKNHGIGNDSFNIICNISEEKQSTITVKDILYDKLSELYPDNTEILNKHIKTIEFIQTTN